MCILVIASAPHPVWRLVLAANRDEAHARPSAALAPWTDDPDILAGRDLVSGGTWLGVSAHGRLCAVTNLRGYGPPDPVAPSRGRLAADFLRGRGPYVDAPPQDLSPFNPVNFVGFAGEGALFRTNRPRAVSRRLEPGLYGLSNGPWQEPAPKVLELKAAVSGWMAAGTASLGPLWAALRSENSAGEGSPGAGVFVRNKVYGTRCSTLVTVTHDGAGVIAERRFDADCALVGETILTFQWPAA
jgi:uncharacterized protein with NRDE domain